MNPYIDPWFFYWTSILGGAKVLLIVIGCLCAAAVGIMGLAAFVYGLDFEDYKDNIKMIRKPLITLLIVGLVSVAVSVVLPTEETMIKMLIAKVITPDNVTSGIEAIKEAADYIIQKMAELR